MKRSFRSAGIGVVLTVMLGMFPVLNLGCGTIDADGFLGLETCDILNCEGMFFRNLADDHDDMAQMEGMEDAEAHDDEGDDHMDDMAGHDDADAEEEERGDAAEADDGSGSGVPRS